MKAQMYFWKTHLLVESLRKAPIEQEVLKNYYLATSIFTSATYYLATLAPSENFLALAIEAIGTLVVTILGINAVFKANGGSRGVRFLEKIVLISFPLLIKVFVLGLAAGILIVVLRDSGSSNSEVAWFTAITVIAVQIGFFWRLVVHVRNTMPNL
jgi:hypothetical protein